MKIICENAYLWKGPYLDYFNYCPMETHNEIISERCACVIKDTENRTFILLLFYFIFIKEKNRTILHAVHGQVSIYQTIFFVIFVFLQDGYKIKITEILLHFHWTAIQQKLYITMRRLLFAVVNPRWVSHSHKAVLYIGMQPSE